MVKQFDPVEKIRSKPVLALKTFIQRWQELLRMQTEERKIRVVEWNTCSEQNFTKALDHRSFFFKDAQKKAQSAKKQVDELKKILF